MTISEQVAGVLAQHPLTVGEDYYAGQIVCGSCHLCLGDPNAHLFEALVEVLDPSRSTPEPAVQLSKRDPRESQIVWGEAS